MSFTDAEMLVNGGYAEDRRVGDPRERRKIIDYLRERKTPRPRWMVISGICAESRTYGETRRRQVRALWKSAVLLTRRELAWWEREQGDENVAAEIKAERSVFWDPVVEVCNWLQIAQSKLSGFCKELTGSNLVQTVDNVKAEGLKGKMRSEVREFVAGLRGKEKGKREKEKADGDVEAHCATFVTEKGDGEAFDKWFVWKALKAARKAPEFCLNSWAQGLGFASYRRMYRACQVVYRKTPYQMMMELIEEALEAGETAGRMPALPVSEFREWTLGELEAELKAVRAYQFSPLGWS